MFWLSDQLTGSRNVTVTKPDTTFFLVKDCYRQKESVNRSELAQAERQQRVAQGTFSSVIFR